MSDRLPMVANALGVTAAVVLLVSSVVNGSFWFAVLAAVLLFVSLYTFGVAVVDRAET